MNHDGGVKSGTVLAPEVIETVTMVNKGWWGSMEGGIVEAVDQIDQFMVSSQSQGTVVDFSDSLEICSSTLVESKSVNESPVQDF